MPRLKSVLNAVQCPTCLVGEDHPNQPGNKLISVKVLEIDGIWWSQCLVCAGLWDNHLNRVPGKFNPRKGWFRC